MLNAYPDSIGCRLADMVKMLQRPEFADAFSLFYILPTFFHSDLDRGFSIIDYDCNEELVDPADIQALKQLGISIKLDLVLNHLSVRSPQFQDLLLHGDDSPYRDFFIDWDTFWEGRGSRGPDGSMVPDRQYLDRLFMRKPGLPTLRIRFPSGVIRTYWNTFYQKVDFDEITAKDFAEIKGMDPKVAAALADHVKIVIKTKDCLETVDLEDAVNSNGVVHLRDEVVRIVCSKRDYLGQMDLNARSELVWQFYDETLRKLSGYGAKVIRLDAFAYLHKEPGQPNFFNRPGTWEYLERLRGIAERYDLIIFPEIHSEYGAGIHEEIGREGYPIYDFFFPGLVLDALDRADSSALAHWIRDQQRLGLQTINMLGSHDGIPVLDLKGKQVDGVLRPGLLDDSRIDAVVERIIGRGGRTKNLYDADGKKIDYYQVNATFFSALGEDEDKLRLARAIQMFMPGVPQVWYLDLFAGRNDYAAADADGTAKHKEINRTNLGMDEIERRLQLPIVRDQLELIRLRNTSLAFAGEMQLIDQGPERLHILWQHPGVGLRLQADLRDLSFEISEERDQQRITLMAFERGDYASSSSS